MNRNHYHIVIIGGGAAGLYFAAQPGLSGPCIILEKTGTPGQKLLMSGGGQCNLTHDGSIKEFLSYYGENGSCIRSCLYKHNNIDVRNFFQRLGIPTVVREDGKVFPSSMDARQVVRQLLSAIEKNGISIFCHAGVTGIERRVDGYLISSEAGTFRTENLIVATGGASYPSTGSDGTFFQVLKRDLGISVITPRPALVPIYVEKYPFSSLSGVSIQNVQIKIQCHTFTGDILFTHRGLSGPVILNHSRSMKAGTGLEINFLFPYTMDSSIAQMKQDFSGNHKTIETYLSESFHLPRRFVEIISRQAGLSHRKTSSLSGSEIRSLSQLLCRNRYSVSGTGGFRQAMITAGGVSCEEVNLRTMESKEYPGLYFIGEVLDIDGDTGGYNLQFAFSSAVAAASHIAGK